MDNFNDSKALAIEIAKILDKKKAQDVRVLKVESLTVLTDYFVIASGTAPRVTTPRTGCCWITPTSSCTSLCPTAVPTMIWNTCGQTASRWTFRST